jgi:hypothetical protein
MAHSRTEDRRQKTEDKGISPQRHKGQHKVHKEDRIQESRETKSSEGRDQKAKEHRGNKVHKEEKRPRHEGIEEFGPVLVFVSAGPGCQFPSGFLT